MGIPAPSIRDALQRIEPPAIDSSTIQCSRPLGYRVSQSHALQRERNSFEYKECDLQSWICMCGHTDLKLEVKTSEELYMTLPSYRYVMRNDFMDWHLHVDLLFAMWHHFKINSILRKRRFRGCSMDLCGPVEVWLFDRWGLVWVESAEISRSP